LTGGHTYQSISQSIINFLEWPETKARSTQVLKTEYRKITGTEMFSVAAGTTERVDE